MSDVDIFSIPQYKIGGLVKAQKQLDALKQEKKSMLQAQYKQGVERPDVSPSMKDEIAKLEDEVRMMEQDEARTSFEAVEKITPPGFRKLTPETTKFDEEGKLIGYHSTAFPRKFDIFDDRFMSTGVGSQMRGKGFYFGDTKEGAFEFRPMQRPKIVTLEDADGNVQALLRDGEPTREFLDSGSTQDIGNILEGLERGGGNFENALMQTKANIKHHSDEFNQKKMEAVFKNKDPKATSPDAEYALEQLNQEQALKGAFENLDVLQKEGKLKTHFGPQTIKAKIDLKPDEILEYDVPDIMRQPNPLVQEKINKLDKKKILGSGATDNQFNAMLGDEYILSDVKNYIPNNPVFKQEMDRIGIKGIRYTDGEKNNYVILDPRIISIAERFAIPVPLAAGILMDMDEKASKTNAEVPEMKLGGAIRAGKEVKKLTKEDSTKVLAHIKGIAGKKGGDEFARFTGIDEVIEKRPELRQLSLDELKNELNPDGTLSLYRVLNIEEGNKFLPEKGIRSTSLRLDPVMAIGEDMKKLTAGIMSKDFGKTMNRPASIYRYDVPLEKVQAFVPSLLKQVPSGTKQRKDIDFIVDAGLREGEVLADLTDIPPSSVYQVPFNERYLYSNPKTNPVDLDMGYDSKLSKNFFDDKRVNKPKVFLGALGQFERGSTPEGILKRAIQSKRRTFEDLGLGKGDRRFTLQSYDPETGGYTDNVLREYFQGKRKIQDIPEIVDAKQQLDDMYKTYGQIVGKETKPRGLTSLSGLYLDRQVLPKPQRLMDEGKEGAFIDVGTGADISGTKPATGQISIGPDGKAQFRVSSQTYDELPSSDGKIIKTNLFKKQRGWEWTKVPEGYDPNPAGNFPIISVETGGKHIYTLRTDFPEGVDLKKYKSKSEPRLKPTLKGEVIKGEQVGEISVRGKKHPVYDKVTAKTYNDPKKQPKFLKATFAVKGKKLGGIIKAADAVEDVAKKKDMMPGGYLKDGTPTALTRQERAKALGFRVDDPVYHGTLEDLRKFDDSFIGTRNDEGFFGRGHYFARTPGEASTYGPNVEEYLTRGKLLDLTPTSLDTTEKFKSWATKLDKIGALDEPTKQGLASLDKIDDYIEKNVKLIKAKNYDGTEGFMARVPHPAIKEEIFDSPIRGIPVDRPFPLTKEGAIEDLKESLIFSAQHTPMMSQGISSVFPMQNTHFQLDRFVRFGGVGPEVLTNKAIEAGYDGIKVGDETLIFDPKNIRRSDADFDPKKTELDDLLSSYSVPEQFKGIAGLA